MSAEGVLAKDSGFVLSKQKPQLEVRYGTHTTVGASDTLATGLTTVLGCVATLEDVPVLTCDRALAVIGDQAGTPAAGSVLIKTFMPTTTTDTTPIVATTFSKQVNWIAVGV